MCFSPDIMHKYGFYRLDNASCTIPELSFRVEPFEPNKFL